MFGLLSREIRTASGPDCGLSFRSRNPGSRPRAVAKDLSEFPASALQAERDVVRLKPDVLLLDYWIKGMEGSTLVRRILKVLPNQKIVLLCWFHSPGQVANGLAAGAAGALHKAATVDEVAQAVRKVNRGDQMIFTPIQQGDPPGHKEAETVQLDDAFPALTSKEVEVLQLLAAGLSPQRIAERLSIKLSTTRTHINNILRKTESESALAAISYAVRSGLIR